MADSMYKEIQNQPEMQRRKISLSDGRYLYFYTFKALDPEQPQPSADRVDEPTKGFES